MCRGSVSVLWHKEKKLFDDQIAQYFQTIEGTAIGTPWSKIRAEEEIHTKADIFS